MSEIAKNETKEIIRYRPATDIVEAENGFSIYMDLPGVKKEDMVIDLQDDTLTVTGKTSLTFGEEESFVDRQFDNCEYVRSIAITDVIDRERIVANLEGGVLHLSLPKMEKVQPRRIEITGS